ncbi:MAG: EamA family transporter, partial [Eubacteriaceae bacterium]|nr:EamA family transporter [Eubacteriaceae bacterium]
MISKIKFLSSMMIFGTIGIFVRHIGLPSSEIALLRGAIGSLFLIIILILLRQKISFEKIKKNLFVLLLSGIALGFNWIFLFQAYKNTTISNAALSYYFAPVFVLMLAPVVLKEKFSAKKAICICVAMAGMFLIISNAQNGSSAYNNILGVTYGLIAAGFYASLMLLNKFIKSLDGLETTLIQLSISCIILLPYVLITQGFNIFQMQGGWLIYLIILGVIHTGLGFYLFFSGMQ